MLLLVYAKNQKDLTHTFVINLKELILGPLVPQNDSVKFLPKKNHLNQFQVFMLLELHVKI